MEFIHFCFSSLNQSIVNFVRFASINNEIENKEIESNKIYLFIDIYIYLIELEIGLFTLNISFNTFKQNKIFKIDFTSIHSNTLPRPWYHIIFSLFGKFSQVVFK